MATTRFAPSPTGLLHLGHARAALFAWRHGTRCLLRLEDIDPARCQPEYAAGIMEDLAWLSLVPHGPVRVQSQHLKEYRAVLDGLARLGPALQDAMVQVMERLRPAVQQAAARIRQRPERVAARQRLAEVAAAREELLALRMRAFRKGQRWGTSFIDAAREAHWAKQAQAEEVQQRKYVLGMTEAELRAILKQEKAAHQMRELLEQRAAAKFKGPSPGM